MYHLPTPRGVHLHLAPSSVTGFGTAGTEGMGRYQSELKKYLGCSLDVVRLGFCPLCLQPFGVSFCEWLFSVVSCMLHVSRCAAAGESRLTQCLAYLTISGHFMWDSNKKCKKGGRTNEQLCCFLKNSWIGQSELKSRVAAVSSLPLVSFAMVLYQS